MMQFFPRVAATYRRPTGEYVDGRWVADAVGETAIQVIAPQPANGRELQMLPENDRQYRHLKLWTATELLPADIVTYAGTEYRVVMSMDYQSDGNFHRLLVREMQQ